MNYLDLVNNVLRRMRANTVSSVAQNAQSALVGDIVNDAKRQIEESWDWSALRQTIVVPTVASTSTYSLTGSQNRATIIDVQNVTNNAFMQPQSQSWGRRYGLSSQANGVPMWYSTNGIDSNGDTQVKLYPTPGGVYSLNFNVVQRTADLSAEGDEITIPHLPVIYLAYAMAAREEGESGGANAAELFGVAKRILGDAISYDSALNPTDNIFYTV